MLGSGWVGKALVGVVVVGGVGTAVAAGMASGDDGRAIVAGIVDGDTLDVTVAGREERIRLLNINTPEAGACLADEATAFLAARLPVGTAVRLEHDDVRVDRYGRTLAGVFLGDVLVNAEIARVGWGAAVVFDGNDRFLPPVEAAAREAGAAGIGLNAVDVACTVPARVAQLDRVVADNPTVTPAPDAPSADYTAALAAPATVLDAADALTDVLADLGDAGVASLTPAERERLGERVDTVRATAEAERDALVAGAAERVRAEQAEEARAEDARIAEEARQEERRREEARRAEERRTAEQDRAPSGGSGGSGGSGDDDSGNGGSGSGGGADGYTGPRCYAPGGKTYRPC